MSEAADKIQRALDAYKRVESTTYAGEALDNLRKAVDAVRAARKASR